MNTCLKQKFVWFAYDSSISGPDYILLLYLFYYYLTVVVVTSVCFVWALLLMFFLIYMGVLHIFIWYIDYSVLLCQSGH